MRILRYSGMLLLLTVFLFSCSSDTPFQPQKKQISPTVNLSNFSEIQKQIFTPTCAVSGCHLGSGAPWSLDLSNGNAYANLVNINSGENGSLKRVLPGNSGQSFIIHKLEGNNTTKMPPGGALTTAQIDSIKKWINEGALNN